jgi:hypothetical protein
MLASQHDLLANASATGDAQQVSFGGRYLMVASGTFSGATAKVQILGPDGSTYIDVADASLTAAGSKVIYLPNNCTVKGALASGTPSAMYLSLYRMEG